MKKSFKRDNSPLKGKRMLFDETINAGFDVGCFTEIKKFSKIERDKHLADLGKGSETEYQSAQTLLWNGDKSPRFLDWLIECCEKEGNYLNSFLCWAFLAFQDDERVLPAIIKSFSKCPDEDLGNYPALLGTFGGEEVKKLLKERFDRIKNNQQAFVKYKDWNDLAFSLLSLCETIFQFEPDNVEVAECLVGLSKHPNSFNKETALNSILNFYRIFQGFHFGKTRTILIKSLEFHSKTNNPRIFGILLRYLFQGNSDKTYEKFKKIYLKTKKADRYNHLVSYLFYMVENPLFWITKLARELPFEDSDYFRDYLVFNQLKPISTEELVAAIRQDFNSESPNARISALNKLKFISDEKAQNILEDALIDEPDDFIRKQFEKHLKKLKKV
jgi:hypothetical protein